jgi:hypothetical protein
VGVASPGGLHRLTLEACQDLTDIAASSPPDRHSTTQTDRHQP